MTTPRLIAILKSRAMTVLMEIPPETMASTAQPAPAGVPSHFSAWSEEPPAPWNPRTITGLVSLLVIWAAWFYGTWGAWGNLTIDSGREMYVPWVLAEGKTLYKDIWYLYGPASPYFNSLLYRLFGVHLNVLYCAGSLSALGSALFLYLTGMRLSCTLVGWTAAAAVLFQAFHPTLFCFPLPYSFATVYGCLISCAFLWILVCASGSRHWAWTFSAATVAAIAMLLKLEVGAACYLALALLIAARAIRDKSAKGLFKDLALCLPGILLCVAVAWWMVSLRGVAFITQENLMSWPTSYFMRTLGKAWLATTGFAITLPALGEAAKRALALLAFLQGVHLFLSPRRMSATTRILRAALLGLAILYMAVFLGWGGSYNLLFFPQDMVLYVSIGALFAWWLFCREPQSQKRLALALVLSFSAFFAFRILLKMMNADYPIYYNGPPIFCFLLLLRFLLPATGKSPRFLARAEAVICLACLAAAAAPTPQILSANAKQVWLKTDRGNLRVTPDRLDAYSTAIQFMKEKNARGETVLSVPEDTSLYFLSGTHCPTRVFAFTPGLVAPGRMSDELLQEVQRADIRYLIWSNRVFPEGGGLLFGTDFDQQLGHYLTSHYHRAAPITNRRVAFGQWMAWIWERNAEAARP